ncbi:MAG: hypothetical protein JOY54_12930 [Acidobacteriaceae bacterium]|nr:hypothetical protein [Acidobacteriaceae bacterium]
MRTFAEIIAESFDTEASVTWNLKSTTHAVATFHVKSIAVDVDFEQREHNGPWHVGFNTRSRETIDRSTIALAFRIFNGVFQAVREFLETREPEVVVFIAKDEDLASVYETYLRREKARIEGLGYRLEAPNRIEPDTEWTLRRTKPSAWKA